MDIRYLLYIGRNCLLFFNDVISSPFIIGPIAACVLISMVYWFIRLLTVPKKYK